MKKYNFIKFLANLLPLNFKVSFSQEGEDLVLRRIFGSRKNGFYVDVGAHHPFRFSNSYFFYRSGWRGINIDAMPGVKKVFEFARPRDINLEIGVGLNTGLLTYYQFNEPALNTFSIEEVEKKTSLKYWVVNKNEIQVLRLDEILDKYLPQNQNIDFMSIDVEGMDEEVAKSNNWCKYRPNYLILEILDQTLLTISQNRTYKFMCDQGYRLEHKTYNSYFFKDINI
jgi:hypothetical protein